MCPFPPFQGCLAGIPPGGRAGSTKWSKGAESEEKEDIFKAGLRGHISPPPPHKGKHLGNLLPPHKSGPKKC